MALAALGGGAQQAHAQQTLNFTFGYFSVRGADSRTDGDILTSDRNFLTFDVNEFNGATFGGEWLVPFGKYLEGGIGVGYTSQTVPSVYTNFIAPEGGEIRQDLRLRQVPFAFTVRALPIGQSSPIQPYIGGGLALINWHYSESGEFVDFANRNELFSDTFVGDGNATGPVVLGGIRFSGQRMAAGFEVRYQSASADLPPDEFASARNPAPKIDLGGWTYQVTAGVRFGR